MNRELIGPAKHILRWAIFVGFCKGRALCPSREIVKALPPGLHLVVTGLFGIRTPSTRLMVKLHRARAMHFIANKTWSLVHEVGAFRKTVLKVDFMAFSNGNPIRDNDHFLKNKPSLAEY